jgi:hypothetical protein
MNRLKSHKTVEQIAAKHRVEIGFIQKQLKIGIPIEKEHTKDVDLATDIALQHLDEIPDYYTRLKKMETSAKKEHKKFKDIKENCGCCEKDAVKDLEVGLKSLNDISYKTIDKLMRSIMKQYNMTAKELHNAFVDKHEKTPDDWIKSIKEGTLHHWFKGSKSKDGKPGWVQSDGSTCANEPGETKTPKCFSSARLNQLKNKGKKGKSLIQTAVRRKREQDPNQQDKSSGASPTMVKTFTKGKKDPNYIEPEPKLKEELELVESQKDKPGKSSGKKDACYYKVKSRYDVWPSAYASGALVKCRKKGATNWGSKTEDNAMNLNKSSILESTKMRYCPKCKKNETREECAYGVKYWDKYSTPVKVDEAKDHEHSMIRSQLSTISNAANRIKKKMKGEGNVEAWVQSKLTKAADYIDSVADYIESGEHDVEESISFNISHTSKDAKNARRNKKISNLAQKGVGGEKETAVRMAGVTLPTVRKEEKLVDRLLGELIEKKDPCWDGYTQVGMKMKGGKKVPNCVSVKKENISIEDANGTTFAEVIDIIKPEPIKGFKSQIDEVTRLQSQSGNVIAIVLSWRSKYYSLKMFFPQVKLPSRNDINAELQKVYPGSKVVTHSVSEIQPGQPLIQAFGPQGGSSAKPGPNINYIKPMGEEVEFNEDWQKVNRKDKTDGLSQKAVDAYKRENPGSNLQTAVTEKNPKGKRASRRKAFCSRSAGQRDMHNIECSNTPDKPICKARKRWRC